MAKQKRLGRTRRRQPSASQRDPFILSMAKLAKHRNLLSKQAKLHGGKYVSQRVLRKIIDLEPQIDAGYRGIKVPRALAKAAKEKGYKVQSNFIIGPSANTKQGRRFQKALKQGQIAGVKPISAGHMEIVELPQDITGLRDLIEKYQENPELLDDLKTEDEYFLFKLYGNESYMPFINTKAMLDYFLNYRSIFDAASDLRMAILEDTFEQFQVYRLNPQDTSNFIRTREQRSKSRAMRFKGRDRKDQQRSLSQDRQEERRYRRRMSWKIDKRQLRDTWTEKQWEEHRRKSRDRMRKLREGRKKQ